MKAKLSKFNIKDNASKEEIEALVKKAVNNTNFGSNIRGSKEYRQILAEVLAKRNIEELLVGGNYAN